MGKEPKKCDCLRSQVSFDLQVDKGLIQTSELFNHINA